jgi:hypothetical protein
VKKTRPNNSCPIHNFTAGFSGGVTGYAGEWKKSRLRLPGNSDSNLILAGSVLVCGREQLLL